MIGQKISTMQRLRQALQRMLFGRGTTLRRRFGVDTNIDYEGEVGDAGLSDVVSSLVGWKQNVFPEAPLRLQEKDEDGKLQPVMEHPALDLMMRPNGLYHGVAMMKATIWDYSIDGNAFWMVVPNRGGAIAELQYIPAYMMRPSFSGEQSIEDRYWEYRPDGTPYALPADRVIHFRDGIDPEDVRLGCSPLKNLYREMYTDSAAANVVASLLRNRAYLGPIVTPMGESEYDQENVQEVKTFFKDAFGGDNRGDPLVLGRPTSIQAFGYSKDDLDLGPVRFIVEGRIAAALNVSPIVVNFPSGMQHLTYNNLEAAREMSWENGMIPMLEEFALTLNAWLLPRVDENEALTFDFDLSEVRVLQEDKDKAATRANNGLRSGKISRAEAREAGGMAFDETDEVYYIPSGLQVVPVGTPAMLPAPAEAESMEDEAKPEEEGVDEDNAPDEEGAEGEGGGEMERAMPGGGMLRAEVNLDEAIDSFKELVDGNHDEAVTKYGAEIESFFDGVAEAVYEGNEDAMTQWVSVAVDSDVDLATLADDVDLALQRVDVDGMKDADLRPIFERANAEIIANTTSAVNTSLGVSVNLPDPVQRQIIADGGSRVGLVDVKGQSKDAIFRSLAEARGKGMSVEEASKRIVENLTAGPYTNEGVEYRAFVVAREESRYAQRWSSLALYDEAGWGVLALDAQLGDDRSDPDCIARNGKTFTIEEAGALMDDGKIHVSCTFQVLPDIPREGG